MIFVAFVCFLALVVAWLLASNIEGTPVKALEPAPRRVEATTSAEPA